MDIEQLSFFDTNPLEENKSTPTPSRREQLRAIRATKKVEEEKYDIDLSAYKVNEDIGKIYTKFDWVDGFDLFHNKSLGGMSIEYMKQEYMKRQELRESKEDIRFFPSSLGRCKRMITYQMLHYRATPKTGTNLSVLENGTSFHDRMEKVCNDMGILVAPELSIKNDDLCISGRTDAVVWNFLDPLEHPIQGETSTEEEKIVLNNSKGETVYVGPQERVLLIEFKSIKDKSFHSLGKSKPKKEHEMQLQLYFFLTGIEKGIIYYENKNTQDTKEYIIEKDDDKIAEVLKEIQIVLDLARKHELAQREYTPNDIHCRYCDYREHCYPNSQPFRFEDLFTLPEEHDN
ncbi:Dna2/Cas4 domain-containing protein [Enterococcus casseliflavus]|uniref:CRISPR-associated protein Cas4 n=1 Tax=Enterococcus TaxID=1350 RepID=UPI000A376F52|nr:Dna2/Cas4 domain-containing protein [Enterococcus sp. 4E1_DIV0656]OTO09273.1 hypothetical protein A5882_003606 [Enterococcus sp. 4E1_DIV0656]